jgi:hypothetical protein
MILTACTAPLFDQQPTADSPSTARSHFKEIVLDEAKITFGQTVYVPIYSYIYYYDSQKHLINLAATLSIRNTDLRHPIIITAIGYYNTSGQLVEKYLDKPSELSALASADFFIKQNDVTGGLGANFIVEWVAEKTVSQPVIEAVLISTESGRGISLLSPGRVIQQRGTKKLS